MVSYNGQSCVYDNFRRDYENSKIFVLVFDGLFKLKCGFYERLYYRLHTNCCLFYCFSYFHSVVNLVLWSIDIVGSYAYFLRNCMHYRTFYQVNQKMN